MVDDPRPPYRVQFDNARDPYSARNALGITGTGGSGGGGAPPDAQYIVAADDPTLTNDRVLTNTATVTWDFTTPGQAKANAAAGGGGNVSNVGTPTNLQYARWTTATTIMGVAPATVLADIGAQPAGSYQPLDADLTSLAAAAATNVIYYRSAANTWGPVTIGANLTFAGGTLAATVPAQFITSVSAPLSVTGSNLTIDLSAYLTAATAAATYQPLDGDLTSLAAASATNVIYYRSATNTWATVTIGSGLSFTSGTLAATGAGGNVSNSGTPAAGQVAEWVTATTIQGVSTYAKLASPTFTGDPKAPTPSAGDNDTSIATTAFVQAAVPAIDNAKSLFVAALPADHTGYAPSAYALCNFNTALINQGSNYNTVSLVWTPPAGRVLCEGILRFNTSVAAIISVQINKNGAAWRNFIGFIPTTDNSVSFAAFDLANGTDAYQLYAYVTAAGTLRQIGSYWQGALL